MISGRIHIDRMSTFDPRYGFEGDKKFYVSDLFFVKASADKEQIRKEASFLGDVQASNMFPELIEVYENANYGYLGFRRSHGKLLKEFVDDGTKLSLIDKMFIIDGVWSAVQFLMTQSIVHGQIDEKNVMFDVDTKNLTVLGLGKKSYRQVGVGSNDVFGEDAGFYYMINWLKKN